MFYRFGLGLCEAPCFPANSRIVGTWFPQHERATATGIYTVGEYIGLAFFSPFLFWLMAAYSWHALFILVGVVGSCSASSGIGSIASRETTRASTRRNSTISQRAAGSPRAAARHGAVLLEQCREAAVLPASLGRGHRPVRRQFDAGVLPDLVSDLSGYRTPYALGQGRLLRRAAVHRRRHRRVRRRLGLRQALEATGSANIARKAPIITGLLLASLIVTANWMDSNVGVIAVLSVAFFGQGMVGLGWTLISDIAPKPLMGLTGGLSTSQPISRASSRRS